MEVTSNQKSKQEENFTVQYPKRKSKFWATIGILVWAPFLIDITLVMMDQYERASMNLFLVSLFVSGICLAVALRFAKWKLVVEEDTVTLHRLMMEPKALNVEEISMVKETGKGGLKVVQDRGGSFVISEEVEIKGLVLFQKRFRDKYRSEEALLIKKFQESKKVKEAPIQEICIVKVPIHLLVINSGTLIFLIVGVSSMFLAEDRFWYFYVANAVGAMAIFLLILVIYGFVWKMKITTKTLKIRSIFIGGEKEYLLSEITEVQMRSEVITIYVEQKRIARVPINWENARILLEILTLEAKSR